MMEWPEMIFLIITVLLFLLFGREYTVKKKIAAVYPALEPFTGSILKWARHYSVDPDLVSAVIMQESAGDPQAIGSAGEVGLMQIKMIAYDETINRDLVPQGLSRNNPDNNIQIGTAYLSYMIKLAGGQMNGLRYYNAGPTGAANGGGVLYSNQVMHKYNKLKNE